MDYKKYLRKLRQIRVSENRGIVIGVSIAMGIVLLAAAILLTVKCVKKHCGCMDYGFDDFDDDEDFDDDDDLEEHKEGEGCGFASDKDFIE